MAIRGHYVVCGADSTATRVVEELRRLDEHVIAIVPDRHSDHALEIVELGAELVEAATPNEAALRQARVQHATAIGLIETDDVGNVHAALTAEELNPDLRIAVHIIDPRLGEHLETLIAGCTALSASAMSAPEFVAAALEESEVQWLTVGGRAVVAGHTEEIAEPPVAVLARFPERAATELLPSGPAAPGDLVLGSAVRQPPKRKVAPWLDDRIGELALAFDRRLRLVGLVMLGLVLIGSIIVWVASHGDWTFLESVYIALGTVTATGVSDKFTTNAPDWARVFSVVVQILGLVLVSLLTAAIVDSFVGASLARSFGGVRGRPRGHVVVCGLGTVGARVVEALHERGFSVIAIERDADRPGVQTARRLRVPILLGDASNDEILYQARIHRARALLAVTSDDVANLQAGLYARARNTSASVVLRVFDHDLANRVQVRLGLGTTRSVSMLAAPAFASVMLERRVDATVPAGRRVIRITEVPVEAGSSAVGRSVRDALTGEGIRILAHKTPTGRWDWSARPSTTLTEGDRVVVVASLAGLARVLLATRTGRARMDTEESGA